MNKSNIETQQKLHSWFIYNGKSSHYSNNANFTCKPILPPSFTSLAPITSQCPGVSCGPRTTSAVSTNLHSFADRRDEGGPSGYTPELSTACACFWWSVTVFWVNVNVVLRFVRKLDLWPVSGAADHSFLRMEQWGMWVKCRRRWRTVLGHFPLLISCTPVTI